MRRWLALLAALALGCPADPTPVTPGHTRAASTSTTDQGADSCATGGPDTIVAARVEISASGTAPAVTGVVDFEIEGPEHDALRTCRALVEKELSTTAEVLGGWRLCVSAARQTRVRRDRRTTRCRWRLSRCAS